jgi:acyl-[acyl carrier protein]--UDP-N-acetylglucosamine O-acyltransferase
VPRIHTTAIVEDGAQIGEDAVVGPFCFVGARVKLGAGVVLHQGAVIEGDTTIGARTQVFHYSVLGTIPQDKKYQGEASRLEIGDDNVIREHVTVHPGTGGGGGVTRIGLKRRGFSDETVRTLRQAYRAVFFEPDARFEEVLAKVRTDFAGSLEVQRFFDFLAEAQGSDRGFLRPGRGNEENGADEDE